MKTFNCFLLIVGLCSNLLFAQSVDANITLDEVTIQAAKIVSKTDGSMIFPTDAQKNSSTNGYAIIQKLSLPNLRVDNIAHSITAIDGRGEVQLRINGIIVSKQEMIALDPKMIGKIEFIDNPGVRYGDDVAYVINIITNRTDRGYGVGFDITPTLTYLSGDATAFAKWNTEKSEISFSYDFTGQKLKGSTSNEIANYTLNDGNVYSIERNMLKSISETTQHQVKLTYNLADSTAYVFLASLNGKLSKTPLANSRYEISDNNTSYEATRCETGQLSSPSLDLYFFRQLTPRQSITANVVGIFISSKSSNYYDEGSPYKYDVDGKTASALTEVIYENRLKPFTLSVGLNYRYKYLENKYFGDASAHSEIYQNYAYAFSELKGGYKRLRYSVGLGVSYLHYKQSGHSYNFLSFRPKATINYNITKDIQASYTFKMQDRASRIAMISDAVIQTNSMEYIVGNPDLKPSRDMEHTIKLSYSNPRWYAEIENFYRHCNKPNMAHYERTPDNKFLYTQINQKAINLLHAHGYVSYWALPEKLQLAVYGGLQRCFNYGNDYTHCYTSWFYSASITAYLGNFTLAGYIDNGNRWLEGETRGYSGAYSAVKVSYNYKSWQFSLMWSNPFSGKYKESESELVNRELHKLSMYYSADRSNQLSLNISWRISKGKKHQSADKRINLQDTDTGIIR